MDGRRGLSPLDLLLATTVLAIWGTNFVVVHEGLKQFPPLTFAALRFLLASLPLVFLVPRPRIPVPMIAAYGLLMGAGQFGLLLYALKGHISPGLASVLVQTQALFTIGLAILLAGERVGRRNVLALAVCSGGVALIAINSGGDADLPGIFLILGAALAWAGANIVVKRSGTVDMFALVVWGSLFATPALLAGALLAEGPAAIFDSLSEATGAGWLTVVWQSVGNTLFGYGVWNRLLSRYPAAQVAPLTLMVPIFGLSASSWYLSEAMPFWKIAAAFLVLAGLAINTMGPKGGRAGRDDASTPKGTSL